MSLPCIIGKHGVEYIVRQDLSVEEREKLQKSADGMNEIQKNLTLPEGVYIIYHESRQAIADRGDRGGSAKMVPPSSASQKKKHRKHKEKKQKGSPSHNSAKAKSESGTAESSKGTSRSNSSKEKREDKKHASEEESSEDVPVKKRPIGPPQKGGTPDIIYRGIRLLHKLVGSYFEAFKLAHSGEKYGYPVIKSSNFFTYYTWNLLNTSNCYKFLEIFWFRFF